MLIYESVSSIRFCRGDGATSVILGGSSQCGALSLKQSNKIKLSFIRREDVDVADLSVHFTCFHFCLENYNTNAIECQKS